MAVRDLTARDRAALERFVLLASFAPGRVPEGAGATAQVQRWLSGWPGTHDLAIGYEAGGQLVGVALARIVDPVRLADGSGASVPEVLVAVEDEHRGRGIGARLVSRIVDAAQRTRRPALALTVSQRNPAAVSLYQGAGFAEVGRADGLLVMQRRLDEV